MTAIQAITRTVWFAPTKRRHYMSPRAAAHAEASARIEKKYPTEKSESESGVCYDPGYHWREDQRLLKVHARLARLLLAALRRSA
ncbi:hypothetical protein CY658_04935 [Variovorax sp. RO1]|uniref:hypothetical protein n=1 Tax=Variovorax sp. RO1 TaxID=2066034 RepID=UPI000C716626|nr:hypothetical protein [Variovorax sp. RO1]PLC06382.1 hypothetical protein CY658_04935 [Variovorax sp. RO1]